MPIAPSQEALKNVLESLIFVSSSPVTAKRLARAARSTLAEVQPLLDELVLRCLQKDPELRLPDADLLGRLLQASLQPEPGIELPPLPRPIL